MFEVKNILSNLITNFIIQRVKARAIPYPHQPPTKGDATVSVAKVIPPPQEPPAAFATGQSMKINSTKVPLRSLSL